MDEINEQTENMKQIQEALATPIGAAADFDEDELEVLLNVGPLAGRTELRRIGGSRFGGATSPACSYCPSSAIYSS
jgi:hypothetical protein